MKKHNYQIKIEWIGNEGTGTSNYHGYNRNHMISSVGKQITIPGSSDPAFNGDKTRYNPEELLVANLSSCHMLWYLHLCAVNGVNVLSYIDDAAGVMVELENGSGKFESVTLAPTIVIENYSIMHKKAIDLHQKAHRMCFIANSVNFEIEILPNIS